MRIEVIKKGLSSRECFRIYVDNDTYVVSKTSKDSKEEYFNFLKIHKLLVKFKISVPKVFGSDDKTLITIQEDLGNVTLQEFFRKNRNNTQLIIKTYKKIIDELIKMQKVKSRLAVLINREFSYKKIVNEYVDLIEPLLIDR